MRTGGVGDLTVVGLLVCAGYFAAEVAAGGPGFPLDDTWIHLQFARNLAAGDGLVYEPGASPVSGSTAPLWTALLSLLYLVPGGGLDPALAILGAKLLGTMAFLASIHASYVLGRELGLDRGLARLAALLFLLTDWMVWSALSGMEIPLFVLLSLWGMILQVRERRRGKAVLPRALVVLAVASLVRPEGLLLLALAAVDRCLVAVRGSQDPGGADAQKTRKPLRLARPDWRSPVLGLGIAALVLLPLAVFYLSASGSPFPTTLEVKTEGVRRLLPSVRHLHVLLGILFRPQPLATLLAAAGILALAERWGSERDRGLLPALWVLALPLAYSTFSAADGPVVAGNFGRYLFPLLPPTILLGLLGLAGVAERLRALEPAAARRIVVGLGLALLLLPSLKALVDGAGRYALNVSNVEQSDVAVARWIAANLPADARLAVQDIGAIAYFTPNPIIDLAGIVNPEILPYLKGERVGSHPSRLGGLFEFLAARRADVLVLYPRSYGGLETLRSVAPGLRPLERLSVERNITMAGPELLVLATPWGRFGNARGAGSPAPSDPDQR